MRLRKDKTIHQRVDWKAAASQRRLTEEALEYAACDAWITRQIALALSGESIPFYQHPFSFF